MERFKYLKDKNPFKLMNQTFSFPRTIIKNFPKGKDDININENHLKGQFSSKPLKRIWSSQNIIYGNNNLDFIKRPIRNNLYSGSSIIFRAPSVKENRYKIGQLLQKEKNKKLNYFNNIHNAILIKESKLYRKKLYLTGFKSNNNINAKMELKKRYDMKDMIDINDNEKNERLNLRSAFKRTFNKNRYEKTLSSYESSLNRYKYLKKSIEENEKTGINMKVINKNKKQREIRTSSTYKTNYMTKYSKLKSGKQKTNEITKSSETNMRYSSLSKSSNSKLKKQSKINLFYELTKKEPKLKNAKIFLYQNKKQNSFRLNNDKNIEMSKMAIKLNELIFKSNPEQNNNIIELGKLIMKYRTLKEFQIIRLDEASKQDIKGLEQRISLLNKSIKKYNAISFDYFLEMQEYITFLNGAKLNLVNNFEGENNKKINTYFDLEKLVINTIIKQKELEHLIIIKNFLLQVKFNLIKQPDYFNTKLNELSHKYELARFILGLKIPPQNQHVEKFFESIPELKEEKMNQSLLNKSPKLMSKKATIRFNAKKRTKKYTQIRKLNTFNRTNINKSGYNLSKINMNNDDKIENEVNKYWNQKDKIIFKTPDEFIELINNLEKKDLLLIQENNRIKDKIKRLKKHYNKITKIDINEEIIKEIIIKEESLKLLKEENALLKEKYEYILNHEMKLSEKENKAYKSKEGKKDFIVDLDALKSVTYYTIIEKYKKRGMFMFEKILITIKNFFGLKYNNFDINIGYELVDKEDLDKILKLNSKTIKNLNSLLINKYTLYLLKLYEKICQFVQYKDKIYNSIEKNKKIIHKIKEEIQIKRKMENSRNIRRLAEEKRMEKIKNIMQKDIRINSLFNKKIDENIVLKNKLKRNKSMAELHKNKQNVKEKEFNFYVNYE